MAGRSSTAMTRTWSPSRVACAPTSRTSRSMAKARRRSAATGREAGAARAMGASLEQVGRGLLDFRPSMERSPGRLNIFRLGARVVIVDFAHNEAGIASLLDVAEGIASGAAGRAAPI